MGVSTRPVRCVAGEGDGVYAAGVAVLAATSVKALSSAGVADTEDVGVCAVAIDAPIISASDAN